MFGKAPVSAVPRVVNLAVSWLSVSFTILMNIYEQICNDYAHARCKFIRRSFHLAYERILTKA